METQAIAKVKRNFSDYRLVERFVAGLVLSGDEIKSLRQRKVALDGAYVLPDDRELWLTNLKITPYQNRSKATKEGRRIKLLLQKREIKRINACAKSKKLEIIPLQLFISQRGWAKAEIALAQRLRKYQLKEKIKAREEERKLSRGDW